MIKKRDLPPLTSVLKESADRALTLKLPRQPKPYYCSFLIRDIDWFHTWSGEGSIFRINKGASRNAYCDLRVGSYKTDHTTEGGLGDNSDETDSYQFTTVPIDNKNLSGLKRSLWKLSENKFKEACTEYKEKESDKISRINKFASLASFRPLPPVEYIYLPSRPEINENKWQKYCRDISDWMRSLDKILTSWIEVDFNFETRLFVNTEGRTIIQYKNIFSLNVYLKALSKDGDYVEQNINLNCGTLEELPEKRVLKKMISEKHKRLLALLKGKKLHSFSGPVLLSAQAAGLLFHEAIGHRLEGSRLLSHSEGQTFRGQQGKRVLNIPLTVRDNPKLTHFNGISCIGSYEFDDEGTPASDAILVDGGILTSFLSTRSELPGKGLSMNGHARTQKYQRPISRMAVTLIEASDESLSFEELKAELIKEIERQDKPYGIIVYDTCGGETDTSTYDFQAFSGDITYATILYKNGKEVPIRGVDIVGTPLQALMSVKKVGNDAHVDNGFCGAESGMVPVTTISPSMLLSTLELQSKDEELVTQYILPPPE